MRLSNDCTDFQEVAMLDRTVGMLRTAAVLVAIVAPAFGFGADVASQQEVPSVTVTAPRPPDPHELEGDSVPKFIAAHGAPSVVIGQLARWHEPICPETSGMSTSFNQFVTARVQAVADAVGAPRDTAPRCRPNIMIFFTTKPEALITDVAKRKPDALGTHSQRSLKQLVAIEFPVQAWYMTATRGDRGDVASDPMDMNFVQGGTSACNGSLLTNDPAAGCWRPSGRLGTRLATGKDSLLRSVLIIVNTNTVVGRTAGEVADYIAVIALSPTHPPETCGQLPSILDLFATNCDNSKRPDAVTAGDLGFLRALYATDLQETLSLERADILNNMMRQFAASRP
jgi:hypothetical protein